MSEELMAHDVQGEGTHPIARWFSDRLPIVVAGPETERRARRWNRWADRQIVRRSVAIFIVFFLAVVLAIWMGTYYKDHLGHMGEQDLFQRVTIFVGIVPVAIAMGNMLLWSKVVYTFAGSSTEDRAMLEYGLPYDKLTLEQRRRMVVQYRAEIWTRFFRSDERQDAQRERAERAAYRVLRWTVVAMVAMAWVAYLIVPERAFAWLMVWGRLLVSSPLMLTWLALAVIVLPVMIRMWMEPDEVGEPCVVKREA
jgi:hypothetical protein